MAGLSGGSGGGSGAVRAGRAFVEFFGKDGVSGTITGIERRLKSFGSSLTRVGATATAFGAAALAPMLGVLQSLQDLSKQGAIATSLGLTAEQFSGIAGVAKAAGEDTKEFIESLVTLGKVATEGALGKGAVAPQFFKDLNLDAKEFAELRADEQFFKFFEAAQAIADPLTRVRTLMVAFGEDGGKLLLPLLEKTPAELRRMAAGFQVSGDDMATARAAQFAYAEAVGATQRAWRQIVVAVAPAVKQVSEAFALVARPVSEMIRENRQAVTVFLALATAAAAAGVALAGVGLGLRGAGTVLTTAVALVSGLATATIAAAGAFGTLALGMGAFALAGGLVASVLGAIAPLFGSLLNAGMSALGGLRSSFGELASAAGKAFEKVGEIFTEAWGGIEAAVKSGNLKLAFEIAAEGVKAAWFEMLAAMAKAFANFVKDNKDKIVALGAILGTIEGAKMGGRFGPWGTLFGGLGGGVIGGVGADAIAKKLEGLGDTKGLDAAAEAAKARLAALVAGAKAVVPAPGVPVDPAEADRRRQQKEMNRHLRVFDAAKGAFFTPAAKQQFGYGDGGAKEKQGLDAAKETAKNTAKTAVEVARLVLGLKMA